MNPPRRNVLLVVTAACLGLTVSPSVSRGDDDFKKKHQQSVKKALDWLVKRQDKDGYWGMNEQKAFPVAITGIVGVALLAEGSTTQKGQYAKQIRKAVDWTLMQVQASGLISDPTDRRQAGRYLFGHAYATLFLSSVYATETDAKLRKRLRTVLENGAVYALKAQTSRGGWGYVAAQDGNDFDEGAVTVAMVHGLKAAKLAGIKLPKEVLPKAFGYLEKATNEKGGVVYSLAQGGRGSGRPALTAAALAGVFGPMNFDKPLAKNWIRFCDDSIGPMTKRIGAHSFAHFYYAQALHAIGDEHKKLFPNDETDWLTWEKYRKMSFAYLMKEQQADGGWKTAGINSRGVTTAFYVTVLQLENRALHFQRRLPK